jgi:glucose-6-phosphate isomerase
VKLRLIHDVPDTKAAADAFRKHKVLPRLKRLDDQARRRGFKGLDGRKDELIRIGMEANEAGEVTKNSYGVFHLSWLGAKQSPKWIAALQKQIEEIEKGIATTHKRKIRYLLWAGMGGSAEDKAAYEQAGLLKKGPRLFLMDTTDPARLATVLGELAADKGGLRAALESTLVVGMAMGMTSYEPVVNLTRLAHIYDAMGIDSRPNFIYLTLPGSLLDQFASARGYRRLPVQPDGGNATAGRHSSPLTHGSLLPLALAKVNLKAWFAGTVLPESDVQLALRLASFLHGQGLDGRDKCTLFLPKAWRGAGMWTKQNFEESLGKSEQLGLRMVYDEPAELDDYHDLEHPRQDRCFLIVRHGSQAGAPARFVQALQKAGYSAATLDIPATKPLSAYMQFMHYVVFGLGWLRRMNFVTQPSVELYKAITSGLVIEAGSSGGIQQSASWHRAMEGPRSYTFRKRVTLHANLLPETVLPLDVTGNAAEVYASLMLRVFAGQMASAKELTWFGCTRYSPAGELLRSVLAEKARVLRALLGIVVDVAEGPAMNHSFHEMIIGHGDVLSTVLVDKKGMSVEVAQADPSYHHAQFLATQMALAQRDRLVCAVTLEDSSPASIRELATFFEASSKWLSKLI